MASLSWIFQNNSNQGIILTFEQKENALSKATVINRQEWVNTFDQLEDVSLVDLKKKGLKIDASALFSGLL